MNQEPTAPRANGSGIYLSATNPSTPNYWTDLERNIPFAGLTVNVMMRVDENSPSGKKYLVQCNQLPGAVTLETDFAPQSQEIGLWLEQAGAVKRYAPSLGTRRLVAEASGMVGNNELEFPSIKMMAIGLAEYVQALSPSGLVAREIIGGKDQPIDLEIAIPGISELLTASVIRSAKSMVKPSGITMETLEQWRQEARMNEPRTHGGPGFSG